MADGDAGMYGMVLDNTHSKTMAKNVTFVVMTFPTSAPPKSGQQQTVTEALGRERTNSVGRANTGSLKPSDSLKDKIAAPTSMPELKRTTSKAAERDTNGDGQANFFTGSLSKKRRKKNQGYARRYFSLDFDSSTLSYYRNRNSTSLRGSIPLSLAAVGADEKSRQISIDSGSEIWILKASNPEEFKGWRDALERASQQPRGDTAPGGGVDMNISQQVSSAADDSDWNQAEALVGKVEGITNSVRRLAKDTDPKYMSGPVFPDQSPSGSPIVESSEGDDYFEAGNNLSSAAGRSRIPWRRRSSAQGRSPSGVLRQGSAMQKSGSTSLAIPSPNHGLNAPMQRSLSTSRTSEGSEDVHGRCMSVLRELEGVVAQFSSLITESRQRRTPKRPSAVGRNSIDSTFHEEFFDADDGLSQSNSQILRIRSDSDEGEPGPQRQSEATEAENDDSSSESDLDEADDATTRGGGSNLFPSKPKSLSPLPQSNVKRRDTIPASVGQPPSLIGFFRKNVGKDLSTISMPVTANEPLSLLQRQAEQMEYSELLDSAVNAPADTGERLLHIAAFAISSLSNSRQKERAIRKPFNPMLGETYELVREDRGFRYLSEKISHRPVRVACQAEAKEWTFTHAPSPTQKFWGKSAEINTDGKARVRLHASGDCYSWTPATCFLRNVIAGEKYVEPVSSMTIAEETSGRKAVATFKAGGMFAGRSEDVNVQVLDPSGKPLSLSLEGKWTSQLALSDGKEIWKVGPLIKDAPKHYGMTAFAATLNEVTSIEGDGDGKALPPTDSRKRPDQRKYEDGDVDGAEQMKAQLEEAQRSRRKDMETKGETWEPRWFGKVGREGDEDAWVMKGDKEGNDYWKVREGGKWDGVGDVFQL